MEDYIQHKIHEQFYVDLAPSILANYLNAWLHVINEDAQGDCGLYTFDPLVEPMPLAIAVRCKELPDIGPHYSGVAPSERQKPDTPQMITSGSCRSLSSKLNEIVDLPPTLTVVQHYQMICMYQATKYHSSVKGVFTLYCHFGTCTL